MGWRLMDNFFQQSEDRCVINEEFDFLTAPNTDAASIYLDGFYMYLLPMLDGILRQEAEKISLKVALGLGENHSLSLTLKERLISMAV
jgi:hypothetical protein